MRDEKSGFKMSYSLLATVLMLAIAAAYLLFQVDNTLLNAFMIPIALVGMLTTYGKTARLGLIWSAGLTAALAAASVCFFSEQLIGLVFWVVWQPVNLFFVNKLRTGVAGMTAERDFYRSECARVAMIDPITQMRNRHAFLNDAPIYIRIARRYQLDMVVVVIWLKNNGNLREALGIAMHNEMLEEISRTVRRAIRMEDLAYLVDNNRGVWGISMFTRPESIDVVFDRIRKGFSALNVKDGDGNHYDLDFAFGHTVYDEQDDPTPSSILRMATDVAEGKTES